KPYKVGGGNETKTLQLKNSSGKEYTLRSIDKSRNDVVLPEYRHTFIEDIINDGVSMSYPYGAFALPVMEQELGIYHTYPQIVFLPKQPALDTFNNKFGDDLYLFEQRLNGDWSDANNLGNFKYFTATDDLVEKLEADNTSRANQFAFLKARLFDMLIADWDRHEDNWQWGSADTIATVYTAVPRDRDQAFFTHDGIIINQVLKGSELGFMQNFGNEISNIKMLNYEERNMDRFFLNEMNLNDWINAVKSIQAELTDTVIEKSIQQLPPEIFKISGNELITKLKVRRNHFIKYAKEYYLFLAKQVKIIGSKQREYFYVNTSQPGETTIQIFRIDSVGKKSDTAFYLRKFNAAETKEIRLYGIDGEDMYEINGSNSDIHLRIFGGPAKDSFIEINSSGSMDIYDNRENVFETQHASLHLKKDSIPYNFKYADFNYNKRSFKPSVFYNNEDRLFVGLGYGITTYSWRSFPFASKQKIDLHYSISQGAISATYSAIFTHLINKWNFTLLGNFDAIRWTNFFGLGNETELSTTDKNYFRMRTREGLVNAGINRNFGKSNIAATAFFQSVKILNDTERYVSKVFQPLNQDALETNNYTGVQLTYTYFNTDDSVVPVKGITFYGNAAYTFNPSHAEFFQKYFGKVQIYVPLFDKFSLAIKGASATIAGNKNILNSAEFYEHAVVGGPESLRGFKRERFWGKTSFYNNNELRYITNIKTHVLNAKAGLLVFFDDGRVWIPNEKSNTLHTAYGAGIILAPFNKFCGTITYGISKESNLIQIKINKLF
ncbi:MAG TPA: BamA/TamA family outer membrane protein, partial [Parafilimonas sp.]|nr:BamA/TamA family outer membrane protein [Parafilimonas sp.]